MPAPVARLSRGIAYHVLNRRVMRRPIFEKPGDHEAFERIPSIWILIASWVSCGPGAAWSVGGAILS